MMMTRLLTPACVQISTFLSGCLQEAKMVFKTAGFNRSPIPPALFFQ
jgi:hypothetical protein